MYKTNKIVPLCAFGVQFQNSTGFIISGALLSILQLFYSMRSLVRSVPFFNFRRNFAAARLETRNTHDDFRPRRNCRASSFRGKGRRGSLETVRRRN